MSGLAAFLRVHWVQVSGSFGAILLTLAKMNEIPSFCPLYCFMLVALLANMALFRVFRGFLEGFVVVVWVCVVLVVCVACVAFVRVWS